jgi:malate dehydrogenase (oxaloacetate-decarboxylating)
LDIREEALKLHRDARGKIAVVSKVPVNTTHDLSLAYSPGVAEPCKKIAENREDIYTYTNRGNTVAVVSDGTAVLGLGDIGPYAALPVMEGKSILFKTFADIDAFPICLDTKDIDEIVETTARLAPNFGGVNLEDISGPRCFEVERRLKEKMDIPVFHDDQHGTAVVCFAGLLNALKLSNRRIDQIKIVVNGAGAAGCSITRLLLNAGAKQMLICDKIGILAPGSCQDNPYQEELAKQTNPSGITGTLAEALQDADVFIGVSAANILKPEMVRQMAKDPIIFAMANPNPEIMPDVAREAGAFVVGTGRSDYPNQVNNVLGFPGIFRGALDVRASSISEGMKIAAARAIAGLVDEEKLNQDYVIPNPLDPRVVPAVAAAVAQAAMDEGLAKVRIDREKYAELLAQRFMGVK